MSIRSVTVNGSSHIRHVGYTPETRTLSVTFANGAIYDYADVPYDAANGLVKAESAGRYLSQIIKPAFKAKRREQERRR